MALEQFERWARRAQHEPAPQPDVAHAVMGRLRRARPEPAARPSILLWAFSGASACAAAVCALLGYHAWLAVTDPFQGWMENVSTWWML